MRKRLVSQKYLKNVNKYSLKIFINERDYYAVSKKIVETSEPFYLKTGLCLMNNGYYIVEIIPKNKNYAMRVFLDENKNILEHYFDISNGNGLDEETKIPYYDDLYLDITVINGEIELIDKNELDQALANCNISQETYDNAIKTSEELIFELKNNTNEYFGLNVREFL